MAELIETGDEPEYVVSDMAYAEFVDDSKQVLRMCFAHKKHGRLVAQYTTVVSVRDLVKMIKSAGEVVADQGGLMAFASEMDAKAH